MIDLSPFERWSDGKDWSRGDVWQYGQMIAEVCLVGRPNVVLELGAHEGTSMRAWREAWSPDILIGVELEDSPSKRSACEGLTVVWGDCNSEVAFREVKHRLGSSRVDFLFIDADHTYEGMQRSFEMYAPIARRGGIIILDDVMCRAPSHGVWRIAEDLQEHYSTKVISAARLAHVAGEGILAVYP